MELNKQNQRSLFKGNYSLVLCDHLYNLLSSVSALAEKPQESPGQYFYTTLGDKPIWKKMKSYSSFPWKKCTFPHRH